MSDAITRFMAKSLSFSTLISTFFPHLISTMAKKLCLKQQQNKETSTSECFCMSLSAQRLETTKTVHWWAARPSLCNNPPPLPPPTLKKIGVPKDNIALSMP